MRAGRHTVWNTFDFIDTTSMVNAEGMASFDVKSFL